LRKSFRVCVDTGGTFTDAVVLDEEGRLSEFKVPSTPADFAEGVLNAISEAARSHGKTPSEFISETELVVHGTTVATNALVTRNLARTAMLTTKGFRDIIEMRRCLKIETKSMYEALIPPYEPIVPRYLRLTVEEETRYTGEVAKPVDAEELRGVIERFKAEGVQALAVCFVNSYANPENESQAAELCREALGDVFVTYSYEIVPKMGEYERESTCVISAAVGPIVTTYILGLERRLRDEGFKGQLLIMQANQLMQSVAAVIKKPVHLLVSGPAAAPPGASYLAGIVNEPNIITADMGGTTLDVALIRGGEVPLVAGRWFGDDRVGIKVVDVSSIGAGGGSIAWIDEGGMLHVGPESAGADPGPACYGKGGTHPTVTDACVVLGYIDPGYFLGGAMPLDADAARSAVLEHVGVPLGMTAQQAASAIMQVLDEHMVQLIEDLSVNQGVDPREAVMIGGGGAAGLNAISIGRRLGSTHVIIPETGAALSAFGALLSDLSADFATTSVTSSDAFDYDRVNGVLADLVDQCHGFIDGPGAGSISSQIELSAEMRYPAEVWEIEVPLRVDHFRSAEDVEQMRQDLHAARIEVFGTSDPTAAAHVVTWRAKVSCRLREGEPGLLRSSKVLPAGNRTRPAYFPTIGLTDTTVRLLDSIHDGEVIEGPAIVESAVTTIVVVPGASAIRTAAGSLLVTLPAAG
jgi:N-methylhydantoinase A